MPATRSTRNSNVPASQSLSTSSGYLDHARRLLPFPAPRPRSPVSESIERKYSQIKDNLSAGNREDLNQLLVPHAVSDPATENMMYSRALARCSNTDADTFLYPNGHREVHQTDLTAPRAFVGKTGRVYTRTHPDLFNVTTQAPVIPPVEQPSLVERTRQAAEHRKHMREKLRQDMGVDNWLKMVERTEKVNELIDAHGVEGAVKHFEKLETAEQKRLKQEAKRKKWAHAAALKHMHASATALVILGDLRAEAASTAVDPTSAIDVPVANASTAKHQRTATSKALSSNAKASTLNKKVAPKATNSSAAAVRPLTRAAAATAVNQPATITPAPTALTDNSQEQRKKLQPVPRLKLFFSQNRHNAPPSNAGSSAAAGTTVTRAGNVSSSAKSSSTAPTSQATSGLNLKLRLGAGKPKAGKSNLSTSVTASPTRSTSEKTSTMLSTIVPQSHKRKAAATTNNEEEPATKKTRVTTE